MSVMDPSPLSFICSNCNAMIGERCTRPSEYGRVIVTYFHTSRITLAQEWQP